MLPWQMAAMGLLIGSFLNVCILRLPEGLSIVRPASRCPGCGHGLAWYENVPVVSFLILRARCRNCGAPISWQYPLIEMITCAVFVAATLQFGFSWLLLSRVIFGSALIVLFMIDLRHHILPNGITLPGIVVGFAFSLLTEPGWMASLIGIVAGGGILLAIAEGYYLVRREQGLGMGDVKMLAMIGAFLGWKLMILTLVFSSLVGSIVGVGMIVSGKGSMKYALPFGTFLAIGAALSATVGPALLDWYFDLY
jgi:leader peptidase (prepilin peptidase)/N-methyltransferase